jgi:zinc and cadmium transporter
MWSIISVFIAALLAGLVAFPVKKYNTNLYRLFLVFSGSFLFAITITHLLPDLFAHSTLQHAGLYVLGGFIFQQILEYFSSGIEHGHLHAHQHEHANDRFFAVPFLIALVIHSVMEGIMLGREGVHEGGHSVPLLGIILHKMPAAFALMTILLCHYKKNLWPVVFLLIFALATPLGMILTSTWLENGNQPWWWEAVYGIVIGNFLHISTTIVFESSTDHQFHARRIGAVLAGAGIAILIEVV